MASEALTIENLEAGYGSARVLDRVSLTVAAGEAVALLGANGNGKTTLMRCVLGLVRPSAGAIRAHLGGRSIALNRLAPEEIVDLGVALVPEGRRLFRDLSVEDNLALGAYRSSRAPSPQGEPRVSATAYFRPCSNAADSAWAA